MKTLTVRLPEALVAEIDAEARRRKVSRSDVVRERLSAPAERAKQAPLAMVDIVGSVEGLPSDLSARRKKHLKSTGYGARCR